MIGEHARALFQLSRALLRVRSDDEEGQRMKTKAEKLLHSHHPDPERLRSVDVDQAYDDLVFILWR